MVRLENGFFQGLLVVVRAVVGVVATLTTNVALAAKVIDVSVRSIDLLRSQVLQQTKTLNHPGGQNGPFETQQSCAEVSG